MAELDSVQSQIEDAKEEMLKPYRISTVSGDRYGGGWPRERLHAHGITYHLAAQAPPRPGRALLPR